MRRLYGNLKSSIGQLSDRMNRLQGACVYLKVMQEHGLQLILALGTKKRITSSNHDGFNRVLAEQTRLIFSAIYFE